MRRMSTSKDFPEKDPFHVLGIPPHATETEISKAYRKLALQWHPDKQEQGLSDHERERIAIQFHDIQQARSFLLDPEHREAREKYIIKRASEELRRQTEAAREKGMSERRKRMRDALYRQEAQAETTRAASTTNASDTVRDEKARMEELRRKGTQLRESYAAKAAAEAGAKASMKLKEAKRLLEDRQIRLKWSRKKTSISPSEHSIATLLSQFGIVEHVEMLGYKGNMALVTFATTDSCRPCVDYYKESEEMRASFVGKRKEQEEENVVSTGPRHNSSPLQGNLGNWKLERASERERVLREVERAEEDQNMPSTFHEPSSHRSYPPKFSDDHDDRYLTPLERLEKREVVVLRNLLAPEMLQKIQLADIKHKIRHLCESKHNLLPSDRQYFDFDLEEFLGEQSNEELQEWYEHTTRFVNHAQSRAKAQRGC